MAGRVKQVVQFAMANVTSLTAADVSAAVIDAHPTDGDRLYGGLNKDVFLYRSVEESSVAKGVDRITDFTKGEDKVDLRGTGIHDLSEWTRFVLEEVTGYRHEPTGFALTFTGDVLPDASDMLFAVL